MHARKLATIAAEYGREDQAYHRHVPGVRRMKFQKRGLAVWWVDHPWADAVGAVAAAIAWFLPAGLVSSTAISFSGASSAVIALLATVVTFACSSVYQAQSGVMVDMRENFGRQLRRTWIYAVGFIVAAAVVALAGIPVSYGSTRAAYALVLAALGVALSATLRALYLLNVTFKVSNT